MIDKLNGWKAVIACAGLIITIVSGLLIFDGRMTKLEANFDNHDKKPGHERNVLKMEEILIQQAEIKTLLEAHVKDYKKGMKKIFETWGPDDDPD